MMSSKTHFISILSVFVFFVFALLCRGGLVYAGMDHHGLSNGDMSPTAPCCDMESPMRKAMNHEVAILPNMEKISLVAVVISGLYLLGSALLSALGGMAARGAPYIRNIRMLLGSTKWFEPFFIAFRRGIMHPKSW